MALGERFQVEVVFCAPAGSCQAVPLQLAPGATVADALRLSGLLEQHGLTADTVKAGVWGRVREGHTLLRDRDRVEIYRALVVDPKEARRLRYKRHGPGRSTAAVGQPGPEQTA
jgi:putative ubiquitin-RnfH superfamily antitoxin RatB of RatAB toxin-antitoxin module